MVARVADDEVVGADAFETVAGVETLRAEILAPHADPQRARAVASVVVARAKRASGLD